MSAGRLSEGAEKYFMVLYRSTKPGSACRGERSCARTFAGVKEYAPQWAKNFTVDETGGRLLIFRIEDAEEMENPLAEALWDHKMERWSWTTFGVKGFRMQKI